MFGSGFVSIAAPRGRRRSRRICVPALITAFDRLGLGAPAEARRHGFLVPELRAADDMILRIAVEVGGGFEGCQSPAAMINACFGRILAVPDPLLEVRSPVLFQRSRRLRDRRHQWRRPKMLCAISRPIPQPNPCTTDRIRPAPCSGAKTVIAPTAKPARTIILTTMLLEIEAEETDRRGRRERAVRRRNSPAGLSRAGAARRSPQRPR